MSDDILLDEWNDAFLDQLIRTQEEFVLTSRSSAPKPPPPPPPPTSAVNFFSPPRELSQRPPTSIIVDSPSPTPNQSSDNKDLEIDRLKRELEQSIKQFANLKKEHVKLKKERDNIEDQLKSISSRNEEENASSKSKSSDTQIKIKWWKKFDVRLINKEKIMQWARNNRVPRSQLDIEADKEALFLAQKSQIMAELATATSQEEFEEKIQRMRGISQEQKSIKDEGSSSSTNPYQKNRDMLDYFTKEEFSE